MTTTDYPEQKSDKVEYSDIYCRCVFSPEELKELAEDMAAIVQELEEIEAEKKSAMASFKERIERKNSELKAASRKYKDGYEMRDVTCYVDRDFFAGEIRHIRSDTGEVARTTKMTAADRQRHIDDAIEKKPEEEELSNEEIIKRRQIEYEMRSEKSSF